MEEMWDDITEWQLEFQFEDPKPVGELDETNCACIVCKRGLYNVMGDTTFQPMGGTAFMTYGHYGSTVFDPMDGSALEIVVCDDCIRPVPEDDSVCDRTSAIS